MDFKCPEFQLSQINLVERGGGSCVGHNKRQRVIGLLAGSTWVGLNRGQVAARDISQNEARAQCICKMIR